MGGSTKKEKQELRIVYRLEYDAMILVKGVFAMNKRDMQRDGYIYAQRKKGRTYKDIGYELGIGAERVRQLYFRVCRERRQMYLLAHPEARKEWWASQNDPKWDDLPDE